MLAGLVKYLEHDKWYYDGAMWAPMKSDAERGPVGAWARNARLAAGYRTAREATEAANQAGIHLRLQHLQGIESGWDRAGRDLLLALGQFYGSEPPVEAKPAPVNPELVAAVAEGVARAFDARFERLERLLSEIAGGPAPARRPPQRPQR